MDAESIYCTAGQIVKAGDILAKAGSCGKSTEYTVILNYGLG